MYSCKFPFEPCSSCLRFEGVPSSGMREVLSQFRPIESKAWKPGRGSMCTFHLCWLWGHLGQRSSCPAKELSPEPMPPDTYVHPWDLLLWLCSPHMGAQGSCQEVAWESGGHNNKKHCLRETGARNMRQSGQLCPIHESMFKSLGTGQGWAPHLKPCWYLYSLTDTFD